MLLPALQARLFARDCLDEERMIGLADEFDLALRAAFVAVCSRAFVGRSDEAAAPDGDELETGAERVPDEWSDSYVDSAGLMMVPVLDAMQHGYPPSIKHCFELDLDSAATPCYVCRAAADLPAGHEVLNYYGARERTDYELFASYGFAPNFGAGDSAEVSSPASCAARVQLLWASAGSDAKATAFDDSKAALLRSWRAEHCGPVPTADPKLLQCEVSHTQLDTSPGTDPALNALRATARWATLTPDDVARSGNTLEALAVSLLQQGDGIGEELDARAAAALRRSAHHRLDDLCVGSAATRAAADSPRAELGLALRRSEAAVLTRLAEDADSLFKPN